MARSGFSRIILLFAVLGLTAGCANTIRGIGHDTANVVDATQHAGEDVARSSR